MPQIRHDLMPSTVGDAEWLVFTEAKYGGFVTDVPRNKVSEFDPRTAAQAYVGGMIGGDRMSPAHHNYAPQYARYLKPFINRRVVLVEIGILKGTGLAIWCDLFPTGRIIGLDIDLEHIRSNMDHLLQAGAFRRCKPELHVFDQFEDNRERLRSMIGRDKIDIVIDDGIHWNETNLRSFRDFLPLMSESFVYIVEDNAAVHCKIASKYPYLIVRDFGELTVISERTLSKTIDWRMTQLVRFSTRLLRGLARMVTNTLRRLLPAKLRDFIRTVKLRPRDKICSLRFTFLRDYFFGRLFVDLLYFPYDIHIIFQTYKHTFGRYPNIIRPTTYNEYIQHSKVFRRKSLYTTFADRLVVRDYVKKRIGERHLVRLLWSGDDLHEAETMQLKVPFVIKANNSSGKNIFVTDPRNIDWHDIRKRTENWLETDYSVDAEWQYRWIKPKFVMEEMLFDQSGKIPADWKFLMFHGKVRLFYIVFDRFGKEKSRIFYDESLQRLDLELDETPLFKGEFVLPQNIPEMIQLSEILSNQEPLVRVDWYLVGSNPIFGELTLHPEAGLGRFKPERMDEILYDYLRHV